MCEFCLPASVLLRIIPLHWFQVLSINTDNVDISLAALLTHLTEGQFFVQKQEIKMLAIKIERPGKSVKCLMFF